VVGPGLGEIVVAWIIPGTQICPTG
jgi:hypothetical protein